MTASQHTPARQRRHQRMGCPRRRLPPARDNSEIVRNAELTAHAKAADVAAQRPHREPHSSNNQPPTDRRTRSPGRAAIGRRRRGGPPEYRVNERLDGRYPDLRDGRRGGGRPTGRLAPAFLCVCGRPGFGPRRARRSSDASLRREFSRLLLRRRPARCLPAPSFPPLRKPRRCRRAVPLRAASGWS